ncbi:FKBP-type peptidyl-prolyl cis-trans isomerase SlpA [Oxalobacteraceae bacterium GrIS 2.11]
MSINLNPLAHDSLDSAAIVTPTSYLTLHYRLAAKDGTEIISTFNENPATLQLGMGQLAPALEQCLLGMRDGSQQLFELQAYGPRNPDLVQHVSLTTLKENSAYGEDYAVGDLVEFNAPAGGKFAGVLRSLDQESGLFDFNHPLAGQDLVFEVRIIGIL